MTDFSVFIYDNERMTFVDADFMDSIKIGRDAEIIRFRVDVGETVGSNSFIVEGVPSWAETQRKGEELWLFVNRNSEPYGRSAELVFSDLFDDTLSVTVEIEQLMDVYDIFFSKEPATLGIDYNRENFPKTEKCEVWVAGGRREFKSYITKEDKVTYTPEGEQTPQEAWTVGKYDRAFEVLSVEKVSEAKHDYEYEREEISDDDSSIKEKITDVIYSVYNVTVRWNGCTDMDTVDNKATDHRYVLNVVHSDTPCDTYAMFTFTYSQPSSEAPYFSVKPINWATRTFGSEYIATLEAAFEQKEAQIGPNVPMFAPSVGSSQIVNYKLKYYKEGDNGRLEEESIPKIIPVELDYFFFAAEPLSSSVGCMSSVDAVSVNIEIVDDDRNIYKLTPSYEGEVNVKPKSVEPVEPDGEGGEGENKPVILDGYAKLRVYNTKYPTLCVEVLWKMRYTPPEKTDGGGGGDTPEPATRHTLTAYSNVDGIYYVNDHKVDTMDYVVNVDNGHEIFVTELPSTSPAPGGNETYTLTIAPDGEPDYCINVNGATSKDNESVELRNLKPGQLITIFLSETSD